MLLLHKQYGLEDADDSDDDDGDGRSTGRSLASMAPAWEDEDDAQVMYVHAHSIMQCRVEIPRINYCRLCCVLALKLRPICYVLILELFY